MENNEAVITGGNASQEMIIAVVIAVMFVAVIYCICVKH